MFPGFPGFPAPPTAAAEPSDDVPEGGIPNPPGFMADPINFNTAAGRKIIKDKAELIDRSIQFTPLLSSASNIFMMFFAGGMFMFNSLLGILDHALSAFIQGISSNKHLSFQGRLVLLASGLGMVLFVVWKSTSMGLIGPDIDYIPTQKTLTFIRNQ